MPLESVSIAIATRNRCGLLKKLLMSVERQTRFPDEVVVVDGNSSDDTRRYLTTYNGPLRLRYVFFGGIGFGRTRNCALRNCQSDIVVFIDDDAVAEVNWLETIVSRFAESPKAIAVQGRMRNVFQRSPAAAAFQFTCQDIPKLRGRRGQTVVSSTMICTANFAFRRESVAKAGIWFDEQLPRGEDRYFGYHIIRHAMRIEYEPDAVIDHHWPRSAYEFLRKRWLAGVTKRALRCRMEDAGSTPHTSVGFRDYLKALQANWGPLAITGKLEFLMLLPLGKLLVILGFYLPILTTLVPRIEKNIDNSKGG